MTESIREVVADIVGDPSFLFDPALFVGGIVARAATAHAEGRRDLARAMTHAAVLLVEAAASPYIDGGAVLDGLVAAYGRPTEDE